METRVRYRKCTHLVVCITLPITYSGTIFFPFRFSRHCAEERAECPFTLDVEYSLDASFLSRNIEFQLHWTALHVKRCGVNPTCAVQSNHDLRTSLFTYFRFKYCFFFFGTYYSKYILKFELRTSLNYSNSIYVLSKVGISNTGVRISKYKGSIELHGDFGESVQQV
jgi:hypothetical protein